MGSPSRTVEVTVDDGVDKESSASIERARHRWRAQCRSTLSSRSVDDDVDGKSSASVEIVKLIKLTSMREQCRMVEVDSVERDPCVDPNESGCKATRIQVLNTPRCTNNV
ncbi:uncharacterized protein A4U43_C05F21570 [Asparagus officinalis]|uniref:Uncharacterized protein n=1 Tax=Asparagus officinalis TaxID=4686 RepID=A0A5P1ETM0_ASPOF|nr:uncharacterized protein A4U43_C05F21570 [Asparagus officinalis]